MSGHVGSRKLRGGERQAGPRWDSRRAIRTVSVRSEKLALMASTSLANDAWSACLTVVMARAVAVFLWTTAPSRDLLCVEEAARGAEDG